jgi:flagellar biosynthesis/type III secretory pathway protein FliH
MIERNLVNLSARRTTPVDNVDSETVDAEIDEDDILGESGHLSIGPQVLLDEAKHKAKHIIEAAQKEASEIISAGKAEAANIFAASREKGYSEGHLEGKKSFDAKIIENEDSLKRVIEALHEEKAQTFAGMEDELIKLSMEIVRKIINPAEEAAGGVFESLIRNALRQIAPDDRIMLRISSDDYERFFPEGNALFEFSNGVTVSAAILKDLSLNEYDLIIDKNDSTIDAGLDTQLRLIELAFQRN